MGKRTTGFRTAVVAAIAALGAHVSQAAASTFGTPLGTAPFTGAPNNPYDCTQYGTSLAGPLPVYSGSGLASSCIWSDVTAEGQNLSLIPPTIGTATVTQVRVAVGQQTGRMQVVVMRALYENTATPGRPIDACCFPVASSQVFTPQPDATTTVPVSLPLREDPTPAPGDLTTIADFDSLGLAVLEPGVPVPMYFTGDSGVADFLWNTATPSTVTPSYYSDTGGYFVAMNADWQAGGAGAHAVVGARGVVDAGGGVVAGTGAARSMAVVRGASVRLALECVMSALCVGPSILFRRETLPVSPPGS